MLQPHSYLLTAHFWTLWSHHCSAISREYKLTLQISTLISAVMKTKQLNVHDFHLHFSFNYFWNSLCLLWKLIFIKVIIKRCLPKLLNYFNISKIYTSSCFPILIEIRRDSSLLQKNVKTVLKDCFAASHDTGSLHPE